MIQFSYNDLTTLLAKLNFDFVAVMILLKPPPRQREALGAIREEIVKAGEKKARERSDEQ